MLTLALLALTSFVSLAPTPQNPMKDVRAKFTAAHEKKDSKACAELWRANPGLVLPAIDADLEGSLKVRETSKTPELSADDAKKVADLHARALFGARAAFEASGDAQILDYASAFVGWDANQRRDFRGGQKAYAEAGQALEKKDAKAALEAGQRCLSLAAPLGDWWGAAMGYEAMARAKESSGDDAGALESWSFARTLASGLQLRSDEYGALSRMAVLCEKLGRRERARVNADLALVRAKELGDADGAKELEALIAKLGTEKR